MDQSVLVQAVMSQGEGRAWIVWFMMKALTQNALLQGEDWGEGGNHVTCWQVSKNKNGLGRGRLSSWGSQCPPLIPDPGLSLSVGGEGHLQQLQCNWSRLFTGGGVSTWLLCQSERRAVARRPVGSNTVLNAAHDTANYTTAAARRPVGRTIINFSIRFSNLCLFFK